MIEIIIFIFGLVIGSFNAMLVFRVINNISLFKPIRSHCLNCKITIPFFYNVPLFSYIFLKGRCFNCNSKISFNYFFIELISGILAVVLYKKLGISKDFFIILVVFNLLLVLSYIDFYLKEVPYSFLIILVLVSFFYSNFNYLFFLQTIGVIFLINFFVTFYIQEIKAKIFKKEYLKNQVALGEGDIPVFGIIGGILELNSLKVFILGSILALIFAIYLKIVKKEIETPFIPFLTIAFYIIFLGVRF